MHMCGGVCTNNELPVPTPVYAASSCATLTPPLCPPRPARASQEFLGILLALLMLGVEVVDYVNWARECYHRRLTMVVVADDDHPPLYPIPGETVLLPEGCGLGGVGL